MRSRKNALRASKGNKMVKVRRKRSVQHLPQQSFLHPILAPDSIAIIGASADPTKRGYKALVGLIKDGFEGRIYPINPKTDRILGIPTLPSVDALPEPVDLALICTPAATVPELVRQCGEKGVKGVVVLAAGFRESGEAGAQLEQALVEAARATGVRVIGPNTNGLFNLHKKVNLLGLTNVQPGGVGLISQSGNMLLALTLEAENYGQIGFSTYVGPGNQADVGFSDYLQYLGEEVNTEVAAFYVEGFNNGRQFIDTARAVTAVKPVVVYKSGTTAAGRQAAKSHTGSLAGSYAMTVDLLRQVGISVVHDSDEILPVAEGLSRMQKAAGKRVAILSDGGGQATIATDRLTEAGLELATLTEETQAALRAILLPHANTSNPVDVAGTSDTDPYVLAQCLEILERDPNVDQLFLVGMFGGYHLRFAEHLIGQEMRAAETIIELVARTAKPVVIHSLYTPVKPPPIRRLREEGIPVYASIEHAARTLAALGERGIYLKNRNKQTQVVTFEPDPEGLALFERANHEGRNLYEHEAKQLLQRHGVTVPEEILVRHPDELEGLSARFGQQPLAMKVVSRDILHKSDAGGVRLNLHSDASLRAAYDDILASCRNDQPGADIHGVLVSPMAPRGVEVIVGVVRDPAFGPVLMFGLGGIYVEVLEDVAFRAIPISRYDAEAMIDQIKGRKILAGVRGEAAVDRKALADLLVTVSGLVHAYPQISELDLNPVIAYPKGYAVVDARIICNPGV